MNLLHWADAAESVDDVEHELSVKGLTLGPAASWGRTQNVRDWVIGRRALRMNSALGRIEEIASAFQYDGTHRTLSTPREACGPELRSALYDQPLRISAIELRVLPLSEARWLKLAAKDADTLQACMKHIIHHGVFCSALWTELATGYMCFTGAMRDTYANVASELAGDAGLQVSDTSAPSGLALLKPVEPDIKTWPMLSTRDALLLGDPWAVIVAGHK